MIDKQSRGLLLIVDDDPIVAGVLGVSLENSGFEILALESGQDCLERIGAIQPDAIFLDIEMPGIDGYETCRQLRARPDTQDQIIIFLSAKDDLDSRLKAFDAGGDDFVVKPYITEELCRKASVAVKFKTDKKNLILNKENADHCALSALTSLDESLIVNKFTRSSLSCHSLQALAKLTINALKTCGLTSIVQIRSPWSMLTMNHEGTASPLESSVIELSKDQDRIFQFKRRMIVNFDSISILILDMPIEDADASGRIRDYVALIGESGNAAVDNINLRLESNARADNLKQLVEDTRTLHTLHRTLQGDTRCEMDNMVNSLEGMFTSLGLLDSQENTISEVVRNSASVVMELLDRGAAADENLQKIIANLGKASNYKVEVEDKGAWATNIQLF